MAKGNSVNWKEMIKEGILEYQDVKKHGKKKYVYIQYFSSSLSWVS